MGIFLSCYFHILIRSATTDSNKLTAYNPGAGENVYIHYHVDPMEQANISSNYTASTEMRNHSAMTEQFKAPPCFDGTRHDIIIFQSRLAASIHAEASAQSVKRRLTAIDISRRANRQHISDR